MGTARARDGKIALTALVAAPGRPTTRTVITRSGTIEQPGLAIARDGTATAVWNAVHQLRKRMSEFRGGRWSAPVDLTAADWDGYGESGSAIALAPNGRRLLAWKADDGVRVQVDGEPPAILATPDYADAIVAALADDGSAVVTFVADPGDWSPSTAPGAAPGRRRTSSRSGTSTRTSRSATAASASSCSSPQAGDHDHLPARARKRRRRPRSGRRRLGGHRRAALLARSHRVDPEVRRRRNRVAGAGWLDRPGALRGARLGAPAPTDRTAPKFSVHAPPVVFRRRSGPTTVPIEVRCDEACDIDARFDGVQDYAARTLAAGRSATLQVPAYLPEASNDFRFEIAVAAADRAGNQRRRSVGLRIKRSSQVMRIE